MNIKSIIGVMSCKGGVGKSTFSVNLAAFLSNFCNKKVGLLDADIYGPNHNRLLGISNDSINKISISDKFFKPIKKFNLQSMSFSYFLDSSSAVLLRGPIISNTIKFLFNNTLWENLDFLIIDFPPGTGDIYLSLLRDITFSGMILLTVPQLVSIDDVNKSIIMLNKFGIDIFCFIENMKFLVCEYCNNINYVYGNNNFAKELAFKFLISNFYEIPLIKELSESSNNGIPFVFHDKFNFFLKDIFLDISKNIK